MNSKSQDHLNLKNNYSPPNFNNKKPQSRKQQEIQGCHNMQSFLPVVGVLHSIWINKNLKVYANNIGSAFAITPHLIITCTHNIYSNRVLEYASVFQFVPGIKQGQQPSVANIHRIQKEEILTIETKIDLSQIKFQIEPIKEELALLYVQKPIVLPPGAHFPKLGNLQQIDFDDENDELIIAGYPNVYFQRPKFRQNKTIKLITNSGKLYKQADQQDFRIHYTIKTSVGVSGSPVFAINKHKQIVVVGIHTHSGKTIPGSSKSSSSASYNSGLYFTNEILQKIKDLQNEFRIKREKKGREQQLQPIGFYQKTKRQQGQLQIIFQTAKVKSEKCPEPLIPKIQLKSLEKNKDQGGNNREQIHLVSKQKEKNQQLILNIDAKVCSQQPQMLKQKSQLKGVNLPQLQPNEKQVDKVKYGEEQDDIDEDDLYSNKSAFSFSGLSQQESYQNTSQISKTEYEWITDFQTYELQQFQKEQPQPKSQKEKNYQPQSDYSTDLSENSFLSFI